MYSLFTVACGCIKVQSPKCSLALSIQSSKNWVTVPPNFSWRKPELRRGSGCQPVLCVLAVGCPCSVGVLAGKALSCTACMISITQHCCRDRGEIWRLPSKYPTERHTPSIRQCSCPWSTPQGARFLLGSPAGSPRANLHHPFHTAVQQGRESRASRSWGEFPDS